MINKNVKTNQQKNNDEDANNNVALLPPPPSPPPAYNPDLLAHPESPIQPPPQPPSHNPDFVDTFEDEIDYEFLPSNTNNDPSSDNNGSTDENENNDDDDDGEDGDDDFSLLDNDDDSHDSIEEVEEKVPEEKDDKNTSSIGSDDTDSQAQSTWKAEKDVEMDAKESVPSEKDTDPQVTVAEVVQTEEVPAAAAEEEEKQDYVNDEKKDSDEKNEKEEKTTEDSKRSADGDTGNSTVRYVRVSGRECWLIPIVRKFAWKARGLSKVAIKKAIEAKNSPKAKKMAERSAKFAQAASERTIHLALEAGYHSAVLANKTSDCAKDISEKVKQQQLGPKARYIGQQVRRQSEPVVRRVSHEADNLWMKSQRSINQGAQFFKDLWNGKIYFVMHRRESI